MHVGSFRVSNFGAYVIGRNTEGVKCGEITLGHQSLSRRHAAIVHDMQAKSYVVDLGSKAGTMLNGERLKPREYKELKGGSSLTFGEDDRTYVVREVPKSVPDEAAMPPPPPLRRERPPEPTPRPPAPTVPEADELRDPMENCTPRAQRRRPVNGLVRSPPLLSAEC